MKQFKTKKLQTRVFSMNDDNFESIMLKDICAKIAAAEDLIKPSDASNTESTSCDLMGHTSDEKNKNGFKPFRKLRHDSNCAQVERIDLTQCKLKAALHTVRTCHPLPKSETKEICRMASSSLLRGSLRGIKTASQDK